MLRAVLELVGGSPGESHCAPPIHRLSSTPSAAPRAGRPRHGKAVCPRTTLPSTGHRDRLTERFPMGGLRWLPAFSRWIAIFFAELSQAGCRTRGVDGRLVHPVLGRIQERQFLLTGLSSLRSAREFEPRGRRNIASLRFVIAPWAARYRAHSLRLAQAAARQQTQKETQQQPPRDRRARKQTNKRP